MSEVSVPISFSSRFDQAIKGVKDFAGEANKQLQSVNDRVGNIGDLAKAVFGAYVTKKFVDGLVSVVNEAAEAEKQMFALSNAMKVAGDFSERNLATFENLADQIAENSVHDNDLILSQFALAKQFGATNKEAGLLVKAAVELSARTGIDLPAATNLLGKSLDGTAGKLNELIPSMRSLTAAQLENNGAAQLIMKNYGGSAAAEAKTFSGAIAQMGNAFGDLKENVGSAIITNEQSIASVKAATDLFRELTKAVKENDTAIASMVTGSLTGLAKGFFVAINTVQIFDTALSKLGDTLTRMILKYDAWKEKLGNTVSFNGKANEQIDKSLNNYLNNEEAKTEKRLQMYVRLKEALAGFVNKVEDAENKTKDLSEASRDVGTGFDEKASNAVRVSAELAGKVKSALEEISSLGANEVDTAVQNYGKRLSTLGEGLNKGLIKADVFQENSERLRLNFEYQLSEIRRKNHEEEQKQIEKDFKRNAELIQAAYNNPTSKFINPTGDSNRLGLSSDTQQNLAGGAGMVTTMMSGAQGATKLMSSIASSVGTAFLGPVGQFAGPLLEVFAQGPEKAREMVTEFVRSVPKIIVAIVDAIPEVIVALIEELPSLLDALIAALPEVVTSLAERAPDIIRAIIAALPRLITSLATALPRIIGQIFQNLGNILIDAGGEFFQAIIDGAARFVEQIGEALSNIDLSGGNSDSFMGISWGNDNGGMGVSIGGVVSFAEGGQVPEGFPNDTFPSRLTSGEYVIDRDTTRNLQSYLEGRGGAGETVTINVQVGEAQLAKAIVNLNKRGFRTA